MDRTRADSTSMFDTYSATMSNIYMRTVVTLRLKPSQYLQHHLAFTLSIFSSSHVSSLFRLWFGDGHRLQVFSLGNLGLDRVDDWREVCVILWDIDQRLGKQIPRMCMPFFQGYLHPPVWSILTWVAVGVIAITGRGISLYC